MDKISNDNLLQIIEQLNISHKNEIKKLKENHIINLKEKEEYDYDDNDAYYINKLINMQMAIQTCEYKLKKELKIEDYY
jgi:ribosomal 30S subunit maturation factor RimM